MSPIRAMPVMRARLHHHLSLFTFHLSPVRRAQCLLRAGLSLLTRAPPPLTLKSDL